MKSACGLAVALAVSSLVGCGSVEGGKLDAAGGDAPKTADAPGDDVPSAACDVTKPFGTPARVPGLADMDSQGWLSPDQLTIYFVRTNSTSHDDVWSGTRANTTAAFSNLAMLGGVNTNDFERRAVVTSDGLAMFVAVYEINGSVFQIKVSTRNSTTAQFSTASPVANIYSAGQGDGTPWISEDGLTILFSSLRNNADYDIFRSTRASTGATFGTPAAIAELNGTGADDYPVLSNDGREIFFGTNRGLNYLQIWHATRSTPSDGFGTPTAVTELNVADNTYPNWLSPDRCTLYFTSKRPNGSTGQDLWVATRPQ
jgi:hypothetical protein